MNQLLERYAADMDLSDPANEMLRLAFGHSCVVRIRHLLEDPSVIECLELLGKFIEGQADSPIFDRARIDADRLANQHRGSKSIDGCGHAAVSASYAVANALNGRALQAASYAAYALVYADGGYAAVAQPDAFEAEFAWQLRKLKSLADGRTES